MRKPNGRLGGLDQFFQARSRRTDQPPIHCVGMLTPGIPARHSIMWMRSSVRAVAALRMDTRTLKKNFPLNKTLCFLTAFSSSACRQYGESGRAQRLEKLGEHKGWNLGKNGCSTLL